MKRLLMVVFSRFRLRIVIPVGHQIEAVIGAMWNIGSTPYGSATVIDVTDRFHPLGRCQDLVDEAKLALVPFPAALVRHGASSPGSR
jgi:hypothetical protein